MSPDDIAQEIEAQQRGPFRRLAAKAATAAALTSDAQLREFAAKHPDRHAQSIAIYGRLAGYSDKLEVEATVTRFARLSDSELATLAHDLAAARFADLVTAFPVLASLTPEERERAIGILAGDIGSRPWLASHAP